MYKVVAALCVELVENRELRLARNLSLNFVPVRGMSIFLNYDILGEVTQVLYDAEEDEFEIVVKEALPEKRPDEVDEAFLSFLGEMFKAGWRVNFQESSGDIFDKFPMLAPFVAKCQSGIKS